MADTACRRCGASIDPHADRCPECGEPDPVGSRTTTTPADAAGAAPTPEPAQAASPEPARKPAQTASPEPVVPGPAPGESAVPGAGRSLGSRLTNALKAIGCLVIAGLAFLIAVAVGLLDFLF